MIRRRRVKQTTTLDERLATYAAQLRARAKALPRIERERVLQKARQFDVALHINDWLTSPVLHSPKQEHHPSRRPAVGLQGVRCPE